MPFLEPASNTTQGRFSKLDRPKSELIAFAHRARAQLLCEMTSALCHEILLLVIKCLPKPKASWGGPSSP